MEADVRFTVIVATRNRPVLFAQALQSVLAQTSPSVELVVVDDGSDDVHAAAYSALKRQAEGRARFFNLPRLARGHGPSYALNFGALQARGRYLCFLDDDDLWTDPDYLRRAGESLERGPTPADLHFSNQHAFVGEEILRRIVWIEDLVPLSQDGQAVEMSPAALLRSNGFCHVNTTIIARALFESIGGFDDGIRYENDRDFYLRAIDRAGRILYSPAFVARHNVPDPALKHNTSTGVPALERLLFQLRVYDKAILFARHPAIRQLGARHKPAILKKIAQELAPVARPLQAAYYAREALLVGFGWKWLAYCGWLSLKALVGKRG